MRQPTGPGSLEVTITIGPDGRMYFHDLTPELVLVAATLCPVDPELLSRQAVVTSQRQELW